MQKRVVSGMRPTGYLHLGHYLGVLKNWITLQSQYECYFFVADWHSLTTEYAQPEKIKDFTRQMVLDWLACGIDPEKATIFIQSQIPEHAELHLLLSMMTPISWLERVPSYKELRNELQEKDLSTYGFLGYPLLQTADVVIYQANKVPVGQDQLAHIELSREVARRFNHLYGETFVEPEALLTEVPKLLGTDGRKMSKSYNNSIFLAEDLEAVQKKVLAMMTDPARVRKTDPGNPEICPVYDYHKIYTSEPKLSELAQGCRSAAIGCIQCKKVFLETLIPFLKEHQERRKSFESQPKKVEEILAAGQEKARKVAAQNLQLVKEKMKIV